MTAPFRCQDGAIVERGQVRSLESLLIRAQQLEIAERTTPNAFVKRQRASMTEAWRQQKEQHQCN